MPEHSPDTKVAPLRLFHRRNFVQRGAAVVGGMTAAALTPGASFAAPGIKDRWAAWLAQNGENTPESIEDYVPVALTETEIATLRAVTGRLIPTDELGPGAIEAGVFIYIDRLLAGRGADLVPVYQAGLAALDAASDGGSFVALSEADQDAVLTLLETGDVSDAPEGFFTLMLDHTRQGMFSDPIHGGNREFIGWDLIGYQGIKLVWTEEDQAIGATVEPQHLSVEQFGGEAQ